MSQAEYSLDKYTTLITAIKSSDKPVHNYQNANTNSIILRYDIDYEPAWALELAKINHQHNLSGTFFVLLDSPLYNVFNKETTRHIQALSELDQQVGLHYQQTETSLEVKRLQLHFNILQSITNNKAHKVVSWHNPNFPFAPVNQQLKDLGYICAYDDQFYTEANYISDANGKNSPEQIQQALSIQNNKLTHLLFHPFNWICGGNMREVLSKTFISKLKQTHNEFTGNHIWQKEGPTILQSLKLPRL